MFGNFETSEMKIGIQRVLFSFLIMIEIVLCESYSSLYLTLITFLENVYNTSRFKDGKV